MKNKKVQEEAINEEELYEFNPNVLPEGQSSGDQKYDELLAQYIRLQADFDNFRKRNSSTASVMYASGINDILVEILPVLDYLDMAIEAQKDDEQRKGIELVKNAFMDVVRKRGVSEMGCVGDEFDPNMHEAVLTVPAQAPEDAGKVVEIVKKGYAKEEKILRHAKVVVAQ
ncbi:MAG: nucleotide exchange factor GrpE [Clostridia bacterium]|nr:nucleotide exchange factor GrpE [Clostridia bacterium]MDE6471941.1 nucleotide exchange factor GrpE [Clostridia bacterium]